ncbi:MAG: glutamate--cysteine ligase, partial [Bdellovibrionales bacterium]|nr:glutamate--cysteine ligase [Bdellovibrionales bacterium]
VEGWEPELIISNNDFSQDYSAALEGLKTPINPPRDLGWHIRRKSDFFKNYNRLAGEFAEIIGEPNWTFSVATEVFEGFDVNSEESREKLAQRTDAALQFIRDQYRERGIEGHPHAFIKNNSGTYGLGVVQVSSGDDVRSWSYKARKKMKAAKGGGSISEVIIQEGVPTTLKQDDATAEPALYMVGCQLAGGFLRTHDKKGPEESLNSPGAVYKRLCVSDLAINISGCPMENVYGWIAKLGFLAIGLEARDKNINSGRTTPLLEPC